MIYCKSQKGIWQNTKGLKPPENIESYQDNEADFNDLSWKTQPNFVPMIAFQVLPVNTKNVLPNDQHSINLHLPNPILFFVHQLRSWITTSDMQWPVKDKNALAQVKAFDAALNLTGLIITKLDGTAKGGVLAAIAKSHPIPVYFIGIGEQIEDLQAFNAQEFVDALFD